MHLELVKTIGRCRFVRSETDEVCVFHFSRHQSRFIRLSPKHRHNEIGFGVGKNFFAVRIAHDSNLACRVQLPEIAQKDDIDAAETSRQMFFFSVPSSLISQEYLNGL